jgi:hypothetical protein
MTRLLVHLDWIDEYAVQAPTGIWDEHGNSYYPATTQHLKGRAGRARLPADRNWEEYLDDLTYSTYTSAPNWQVLDSEHPLELVFHTIWNDFVASRPPTKPLLLPVGIAEDEPLTNDMEVHEHVPEPAQRIVLAQSWLIASELARRHPELLVHEMHPGDGMYDVLCVSDPRQGEYMDRTRIMLNRAGTLQVHQPEHSQRQDATVGSWADVIASENPHRHVKAIEVAAELGHPAKAPASTPRVLTYRLISTLLTLLTNDRHSWDARNEVIDSSGQGSEDQHGYLDKFPLVHPDLATTPSLNLWREPESHFWAVLRDGEPVAIASIEGRVYRQDGILDLAPAYAANGHSMTRLITQVFEGLLP